MTPPQSQTPEPLKRYYSNSYMRNVCMADEVSQLETQLNKALAQNEMLRNGKYGTKHLGEMLIDAEKRVTDGIYQKNKVDEQIDKMAVKGGLLGSEIDNLKTERTSLLAQIAVKDEALEKIWWEDDCGWIMHNDKPVECGKCGAKVLTTTLEVTHEDYCIQGILHNALTDSPAAAQEMVERMERMEAGLKGALDWLNQDTRYKTNNPAQIRMYLENALSTTKKPEGGV